MSVQTEIDRISTAVQNAHLKVIEKGGTSAAPYLVANLPEAIGTIPEATEPTLQSKSVTPSESAQTVKPDSGYDGLSSVAVGAISKTYVGSSVPKQAAQTITPGTADKTIASGKYLTGTQTIKGDANLLAGNIKSGVSIFGVAGTVEEGEDVTAETATYTDLLTDLEAAVDALPDAGSGGGANIDTCSITVNCEYGTIWYINATVYRDGVIYTTVPTAGEDLKTISIDNVICGTTVQMSMSEAPLPGYTISGGGELAYPESGYFHITTALIKMPTIAGANVTVTVYDND